MDRLERVFFSLVLLVCAGTATGQPREIITYLHSDITGSPVMATDAAGNVLWKERYAPYGERQINADDGRNSLWFTGKAQDAQTGLSYFGARWYDPLTGRFTGVDPVSFVESNPQSFNRYAYGNNNPYKFRDPDGAYAQLLVPIAVIAAVVIASTHRPNVSGVGSRNRTRPHESTLILNEAKPDADKNTASETDKTEKSNRFPDRPLPRDKDGNPIPDQDAKGHPHSQLGQQQGRKGKYDQAREFDANGRPVRDIDFTDHGRQHPNPHQHRYLPNPTGGTPMRGPQEPLQ